MRWVTVGAAMIVATWAWAQDGPPGVMVVASCEQIGAQELKLSLTLHNLGGKIARDYLAFLHFDRLADRDTMYAQAAPGLGPRVAGTGSSTWGPNETLTVTFETVVVPADVKREVFVKAGMWDPGDGSRLPLLGEDGSRRVLVGKIVQQGEKCVFVRLAPAGKAAGQMGVRPRAIVKTPAVEPAVRFGETDPAAWKINGVEGGTATLERTRGVLCWSEASMKVTYHGDAPASGFVLRPAKAMAVAADAKVAYLWLLGNAFGWEEVGSTERPIVQAYLEMKDGKGEVRKLVFPVTVNAPFWFVHRVRLPQDWPRPLECVGVGFWGCTNKIGRWLALDNLTFAPETTAEKLETTTRIDDAPIPTTPDGPLPASASGAFTNDVVAGKDEWRLTYEGKDGRLTYVYRPAAGTLDDLEATWEGSEAVRLAAESGPLVDKGGKVTGPPRSGKPATLVSAKLEGGAVVTRWRWEGVEYALTVRIKGKSLLVDAEAGPDGLAGFTAGRLGHAAKARFVTFPYWSYGVADWGRDGGVAVTGKVFVSGLIDWYRSAASTVSFEGGASHDPEDLLPGGVVYCPGVRYMTKSDGHRNAMRERFIFTVSPEVGEVLPTLPHPTPKRNEAVAECVHYTGGSAALLDEQLDTWRRMKAYGVEHVYIRHFDGMWADASQGPQEWTLTEHAAPVAGDAAVRKYLDELRAMGFLPVLYTNYTDMQPVAAEFDWDKVQRRPDGDIDPFCWPGSYPMKPLKAVEMEAKYAPRIAARFGTTGSFCDVHTSVAPWHKVDFDARLPGAGMFGTTYRCYAKLLAKDRATYGAVYSEGSRHWLYAGIADGSDAQISAARPYLEPFLVDFDLTRIHPLEMDCGMSWITRYITDPYGGSEKKSRQDAAAEQLGGWEAAVDRFMAATLAYGHQGTFTGMGFRGCNGDLKTYYMTQPVQKLYAMRKATAILYHDATTGKMVGVSEAIAGGAYRESQVYVRYETGLEVWVNGSLKETWKVEAGGSTYELGPNAWVCIGPGVVCWSATVGGGRADYRQAETGRFVDARGALKKIGEFETDGAAIVRKEGTGWQVFPLGTISVLRVDVGALGVKGAAKTEVVLRDEGGAEIGRSTVEVKDGWAEMPVKEGAFRIDIQA